MIFVLSSVINPITFMNKTHSKLTTVLFLAPVTLRVILICLLSFNLPQSCTHDLMLQSEGHTFHAPYPA